MSHADRVSSLPPGLSHAAKLRHTPFCAVANARTRKSLLGRSVPSRSRAHRRTAASPPHVPLRGQPAARRTWRPDRPHRRTITNVPRTEVVGPKTTLRHLRVSGDVDSGVTAAPWSPAPRRSTHVHLCRQRPLPARAEREQAVRRPSARRTQKSTSSSSTPRSVSFALRRRHRPGGEASPDIGREFIDVSATRPAQFRVRRLSRAGHALSGRH